MAHRALGVLAANSLVGGRAGSNCKAIFRRSARRRGAPPPPTSYAGDAASWYAAAQPRGSARVRQGRHEMSIKSMLPVSSNQEAMGRWNNWIQPRMMIGRLLVSDSVNFIACVSKAFLMNANCRAQRLSDFWRTNDNTIDRHSDFPDSAVGK